MHTNGKPMLDTAGNPIHAHGGHMLRHGEFWYWYGEDRRGDAYVSCYRSTDLHSWEYRGTVLSADSVTRRMRVRTDLTLRRKDAGGEASDLSVVPPGAGKVNIERPKVLYCEKTGQFVMWAHYENGENYLAASACIATSDTPDGEFIYRGSFRPYGNMSRDCTLFLDDDGDAYFLSASRDNADMKVYRLAEDYMNVDEEVRTLFQGEYREAPAVFKREGKYVMLSSFCTGWAPNQGKYSLSDRMDGRWSLLEDFGDETTFHSQPAFVLEPGDGRYIYVGDRWGGNGEAYFTSTYVILEIRFTEDGRPYIEYTDESAL
ncbi:MAG: family 43 glycosylhydrolase [Clostridia bacterium]|nr:family 43 glycosylhydrolase [Clostridia bacterium]